MLKRCDYLHYESVILYYRELENFYGNEWEIYKDKFIEYVKKYCDSVDFYYVLIMTNNVKLLIYELMEMPDFDIFCNYQNYIKEFDKESYLFLYVDCLLNKVQYIKSAKDYDELNYNIRKLFDDVNDQLVKQEIAQLFVEKYPKRKKIKEIFDRYLSLEDKEYEYKYSCY